jgi:hypothetical protein
VFEFDTGKARRPMGGYIDECRSNQDAETVNERRREEIRLHDVSVIKAKAPVFWQIAMEEIRVECEKLKATFSGETKFDCQLQAEGNSFELWSGGFPSAIICAVMDMEGSIIHVWKGSQSSTLGPKPLGLPEEIRIMVVKNKDLRFMTNANKDISSVVEFAQYFVSEVFGIS